MIEIFKTNVRESEVAGVLLDEIHRQFVHYTANFDLDDRDRILRVASSNGPVEIDQLLEILMNSGFQAEVLPDVLPSIETLLIPIENFTDEYK